MKRMLPVLLIGAALLGYLLGYASKPSLQPGPQTVMTGHFDDLSMIPSANAQENKPVVMPFNFNSPREPQLAPDAPPVAYWNIDDIRKAHDALAEKAAKLLKEAGSGSSQSFGGGPVHISTRNFSIFMLYRAHREQP